MFAVSKMASFSNTRNKIQAILSSFMHEKDDLAKERYGLSEKVINLLSLFSLLIVIGAKFKTV